MPAYGGYATFDSSAGGSVVSAHQPSAFYGYLPVLSSRNRHPTLANAELHTLNKQIPKSNKTYDQNPTPVIPHHAPNIISYKSYTVLPKP